MAIDTHPEKNPEAAVGNYGVEYAGIPVSIITLRLLLIDEQVGRIVMN